jgi:terminase family protein
MAREKKTVTEKLNKALGIANTTLSRYDKEPVELVPISPSTAIVPATTELNLKQDIIDDYKTTRSTLLNMIDTTNTAIKSILELASEGESARTYEVAGQLIKTNSEIAKDLLQLQKTMVEIQKMQLTSDEIGNNSGGAPTTNNIEQAIIFTGTTEQALQKIKQLGAGKE